MIAIGLDPGSSSGAWAAIDHNYKILGCGDIANKDGRIIAKALYDLLMACVSPKDTAMIVVESVHTMPGQGVASQGKFMRAAGAIEAVAEITGFPFVLVSPQKWKKHHGLIGTDKKASLELARKIFPESPLKRVKDHNIADALLMALWLKENYE